MRWLLWKDYRHNRPIVIAGLLFFLVPHAITLVVILWLKSPELLRWRENFAESSFFGLVLFQLTVAFLGGNAMAGERVDRSAEFLASLPVTRGKILTSKLLLALIVVGAIWLIDAPAICLFSDVVGPSRGHGGHELFQALANTALTGLVFFGVAWFLSSFLASPTFAICGGLAAPVLFLVTLHLFAYCLDLAPIGVAATALSYRIFCLTVAPVCFAVGTWHYLRRVEP
jgi:ABC-type transport system involved in multi-copper enzyme maturation permease subunit